MAPARAKGDIWSCQACDARGGKLDMVVSAGKARSRFDARAWLARETGRPIFLARQPDLKARPRIEARSVDRRIVKI